MSPHVSDAIETLIAKGLEARRQHRLPDAKQNFTDAVSQCGLAGNLEFLPKALTGLGQIERDLGDAATALLHYEEAVSLYRNQPDLLRLAHTVRHLGDILRELGHLDRAGNCYQEALDLYRNHSETLPLDLANTIRGFALLKTRIGDAEAARSLWVEARTLYAEVNVAAGVKESELQLSRLALQ